MIRVSVRLFAGAAESFGSDGTVVEDPVDLAGLIEKLADGRDPRFREILYQCSFFVDGEHCPSLDFPLADQARVDVLPPFAGG
ncbi:MAG TPA: MoaD/ThiS family protein [Solirubrobacterales bacterium]|nr:MoaD/ThiS family protein [Solirubrobacterales bacterium]